MKNIYKIGEKELQEKLSTYVERKRNAELKGCLDNPKYKSVILEIDFRINELKNILLCFDVLPKHLSNIEELFKFVSSANNRFYNISAGHENEKEMIRVAFDKAVNEKHVDLWNVVDDSLDIFNGEYNYENKVQLHVDVINYLAQATMFFIACREIICKID